MKGGVELNPKLKEKTMESLSAVLPITGIVLFCSVFLVPIDLNIFVLFVVGAIMLIFGMGFFQLGAEISMTPIGEGIGVQISKTQKSWLVVLITFIMGAIITVSEPDLQVLAGQVPSIDPSIVLILAVAGGVGLFLALSVIRIRYKMSLSLLLMILYGVVIILSFFIPKDFLAVAFDSGGVTTGPMTVPFIMSMGGNEKLLPMAFDSGGVTTGPITVPFIMAMGVGLASIRSGKNAESDSFGLVALSSVGPIIAVLILGCFFNPTEAVVKDADFSYVETTRQAVAVFVEHLPEYIKEVAISLAPILVVFVIFQLLTRRYQRVQLMRISFGLFYTFIGLILFLCGVNVGFSPLGERLGRVLAESEFKWALVPLGMLIGFFIVKAEPAIQVLNHQVANVTDGAISVKAMNWSMSIGVAVSVGLAMLRVLTGISIQWIVIPGYIIALILSRFVPKMFVGIAFDSGGVASGPMTATFLLPMSRGVCNAIGGNLMTDAFGMVALVAMTPLIAIQIMGIIYRVKTKKAEKVVAPVVEIPDDSDFVVDLGED